MQNVYFLIKDSHDDCHCSIVSRDSALRIRVFFMHSCSFEPDEEELQMYAFYKGKLLAFETIDVTPDDALDMIEAIEWFARKMGDPGMEILPEKPRHNSRNVAS